MIIIGFVVMIAGLIEAGYYEHQRSKLMKELEAT